MDIPNLHNHKPLLPTAKNAHLRYKMWLNEIDTDLSKDLGVLAKPIVKDNPDVLVIDTHDHRPFTERYAWRIDEINRNRAERGMPPI